MNIKEVIEALREEFKKKVNLKEKWERRIGSLGGRMLAIEKFVVEQKEEWKKREEEQEREMSSSERGYSGRISRQQLYGDKKHR